MTLPWGWWATPLLAITGVFAILVGAWWAWLPFIAVLLGGIAYLSWDILVLDRRRLRELNARIEELERGRR